MPPQTVFGMTVFFLCSRNVPLFIRPCLEGGCQPRKCCWGRPCLSRHGSCPRQQVTACPSSTVGVPCQLQGVQTSKPRLLASVHVHVGRSKTQGAMPSWSHGCTNRADAASGSTARTSMMVGYASAISDAFLPCSNFNFVERFHRVCQTLQGSRTTAAHHSFDQRTRRNAIVHIDHTRPFN